MSDAVNPKHYKVGSVEPINLIDSMSLGFYEGNIVKYVSRWKHKNGLEDLRKAQWYLERLIKNVDLECTCSSDKTLV